MEEERPEREIMVSDKLLIECIIDYLRPEDKEKAGEFFTKHFMNTEKDSDLRVWRGSISGPTPLLMIEKMISSRIPQHLGLYLVIMSRVYGKEKTL